MYTLKKRTHLTTKQLQQHAAINTRLDSSYAGSNHPDTTAAPAATANATCHKV